MASRNALVLALIASSVLQVAVAAEPTQQAKPSAAQSMMDQADKAIDVGDAAKEAQAKPIVVPGKKLPPVKTPIAAAPSNVRTDAGAAAQGAGGPVKIVEGSGKSRTTLAPVPISFPESTETQFGQQVPVDTAARLRPAKAPTPVSSTGLPGLGTPAAGVTNAPSKPISVQAMNGVNEMVPVSSIMPNRIATPFAKPKVVDFSSTDFTVVGSDVYVNVKGREPIGIFIRDDRPESPAISLTLMPREIPGVTVLVSIDGGYKTAGRSAKTQEDEQEPSGYEDMLRKMMRRVVLERPFSGYTETNLDTGVAMIGPLRVVPEKQLSGQQFDVYRYRIINTSKEALELSEESFYQTGVKAVAFYPAVRLEPWQGTKVFIVTGKEGIDDER
jgi:conjugal transfer pilus assembly protein TraK